MRNLNFLGENEGLKIDEKNENDENFMIKFNGFFFFGLSFEKFLKKK